MGHGRNIKTSMKVNPVDMFLTPWMVNIGESKPEKEPIEIVKNVSLNKVDDLMENVEMEKTGSKTVSILPNIQIRKLSPVDMLDTPCTANRMEPEPEKQLNIEIAKKIKRPNNVDDLTDNLEVMKLTESKEVPVPSNIENMKQELMNDWTFWYYMKNRSQSWEENQCKVKTVSYFEDMLMERTSNLSDGSDYSLFKDGINPNWDDCRNAPGGRWIISLERRQRKDLDEYWRKIIMFLVEANIPDKETEIVNGAVVNIRKKGDRLAVWLADCRDMNIVTDIGNRIKSILGRSTVNTIQFHIHSEEMARNRKSKPKLSL